LPFSTPILASSHTLRIAAAMNSADAPSVPEDHRTQAGDIAEVVGDHARVARIVLGDVGLAVVRRRDAHVGVGRGVHAIIGRQA